MSARNISSRKKRTYIITKTGNEGICNIPSKSIGSEAPAATAAGIIKNQVRFGQSSFGDERRPMPQSASFPSCVVGSLEERYVVTVYTSKIATLQCTAIARAIRI